MRTKIFALLDCNNFYASCERLFQPSFKHKPIVVLSNNDGCIIARSNEAKALGIPMGEPYFKAKDIIEQNNVAVFSSNYTLYGDMSRRVMATIAELVKITDIEIYSIDEAFIDLSAYPDPYGMARTIQQTVSQWTGIPVSVGLASSKTLAKLANHVAKRYPTYESVFHIDSEQRRKKVLNAMPVGEVWGIGRRLNEKLNRHGIASAYDLSLLSDSHARKLMNVGGVRTVSELQGVACYPLHGEPDPKKMITVSRSFGRKIFDAGSIKEALATFSERAGVKLRGEGRLTRQIYVALYRELSASGKQHYKDALVLSLPYPTDSTIDILPYVNRGFEHLYSQGQSYKKCGIMLTGLIDKASFMPDLFDSRDVTKHNSLMAVMDSVNQKMGTSTLALAASKGKGLWIAKKDKKSPCYTTRWGELAVAR